MSSINEYLLKLAYDELGFYRLELRQNWVAPLQAGVLVVTVPYLIQRLLPRVLEHPMAFVRSLNSIDFLTSIALLGAPVAVFFLAAQMFPYFDHPKEKNLAALAGVYAIEERDRIVRLFGYHPDVQFPAEAEELFYEIARWQMLHKLITEAEKLRTVVRRKRIFQGLTTSYILIILVTYVAILLSGGASVLTPGASCPINWVIDHRSSP